MAHIRGVEGVEHDDNEGGHIHVGACTGPHIYCYLLNTCTYVHGHVGTCV